MQSSAFRTQPEAGPSYSLNERGSTRTLKIQEWTITTCKKAILNGKEIDAAAETHDIPLPEMTFGNNGLSLRNAGGLELSFGTMDALAAVATGEGWEDRVGGGVLVSMAEEWGKKRSTASTLLSDQPLPAKPTKPHDWTYSTVYTGDTNPPNAFELSESNEIPMSLLARQDPVQDRIIFYDDVPLFEDELHDNGESILNVRIRVMPHCFFILYRHFLRVDNVLFRLFDVRIYHSFGTDEIIKEVNGMEARYGAVKSMLESQLDLSPLTDAGFVQRALQQLQDGKQAAGATGKPWPGLGRSVSVLKLQTSGGTLADRVQAIKLNA